MSHMRRDPEQSAVSAEAHIVAERLAIRLRGLTRALAEVAAVTLVAAEELTSHMLDTEAAEEITDSDSDYSHGRRFSCDAAYSADSANEAATDATEAVNNICMALKNKLESK